MANKLCKVIRIQLKYLYDGNKPLYPYTVLYSLQQMVSKAKNRTVQACWEWENFCVAFRSEHGVYPDSKEHMEHLSLDGYMNRILKKEFCQLYSQNLTCAIRSATKAFKNAKTGYEKSRS